MTLHAAHLRDSMPLRLSGEATTRESCDMQALAVSGTTPHTIGTPRCESRSTAHVTRWTSHAEHLEFLARIRATAIQVAMHQLAVEQR